MSNFLIMYTMYVYKMNVIVVLMDFGSPYCVSLTLW